MNLQYCGLYLGIVCRHPEGNDLQLGETRGHSQHLPHVNTCYPTDLVNKAISILSQTFVCFIYIYVTHCRNTDVITMNGPEFVNKWTDDTWYMARATRKDDIRNLRCAPSSMHSYYGRSSFSLIHLENWISYIIIIFGKSFFNSANMEILSGE